MLIHRKKIQVEWGDCDPGGIVYFPRYFEYCDICTNALFVHAGLPKPKMLKAYNIAEIPIVDVHGKFMIPSEYPDTLVVASSISEWGSSSFTVKHQLYKGKNLAAEVIEKRVWVTRIPGTPTRFKGQPVPAAVKSRFK
jgi:4-hydroxybenzoyl-CoA thioesterase